MFLCKSHTKEINQTANWFRGVRGSSSQQLVIEFLHLSLPLFTQQEPDGLFLLGTCIAMKSIDWMKIRTFIQ